MLNEPLLAFLKAILVDNMKEDCISVEKKKKKKKKKKNYGSFKGSSTCCVRYVPSELKRTEKYGSVNGT